MDSHGYKVQLCKPQISQHRLYSLPVPLLGSEDDLIDIMDWIGMAALQLEWYADITVKLGLYGYVN